MIIIVKLYVMRMIVDQREKTCNVMTMDDTEKDFSLTYILQLHLPFKLCLLGTQLYVFLNIYYDNMVQAFVKIQLSLLLNIKQTISKLNG